MADRLKIISFSLALLLLSGCATRYNPATQRKEVTFINTQQEIALGRNMDAQAKRKFKILDNVEIEKRLNEVAYKVAAASDRQDLVYHFRIVDNPQLNAFALPGGFVYVNNGLMKVANNDELACVLAHEIGHIAARHSAKKLEASIGYSLAANIAVALASRSTTTQVISFAVDKFFTVGGLYYSRKDETLADKLSVRYAIKSGYNPRAMITFFDKLKKEEEKGGKKIKIHFLSSHPPLQERIKTIEKEIALYK